MPLADPEKTTVSRGLEPDARQAQANPQIKMLARMSSRPCMKNNFMLLTIGMQGRSIQGLTGAVLFAVSTVHVVFAKAEQGSSRAPTPILVKFDGRYQHLGKLYYPGAEKPRTERGPVVLNFMGLHCPPCRKELPMFFEVVRPAKDAAEKEGRRLHVFLVSIDPLIAKEELRRFLVSQKVDIEHEVLLDPYQKTAEKFGVTGIPRTFVISSEGRILEDIVGSVPNYKQLLQEAIDAALTKRGDT